jgi:E3 ubiquitin-protein ligase SHPRH
MQTWLNASVALDPDQVATRQHGKYRDDKRRVLIDTGVQVCWIPSGEAALETDDDNTGAGAEIKLVVTLHVHLDMSVLFDPLPPIGQDMLALILSSLMPGADLRTDSAEAARASALRAFYTCLRPAPELPVSFSYSRLQPPELVSTLLPFQVRTVAHLLGREGSRVVADLNLPASKNAGLWQGFDLGKPHGRVAYRRLTGDFRRLAEVGDKKGKGRAVDDGGDIGHDGLTEDERASLDTLLDLSGVRGTMLCEEMGELVGLRLALILTPGRTRQDGRNYRSNGSPPPSRVNTSNIVPDRRQTQDGPARSLYF